MEAARGRKENLCTRVRAGLHKAVRGVQIAGEGDGRMMIGRAATSNDRN